MCFNKLLLILLLILENEFIVLKNQYNSQIYIKRIFLQASHHSSRNYGPAKYCVWLRIREGRDVLWYSYSLVLLKFWVPEQSHLYCLVPPDAELLSRTTSSSSETQLGLIIFLPCTKKCKKERRISVNERSSMERNDERNNPRDEFNTRLDPINFCPIV